MAFVPALNTARVSVIQSLHGQTVVNVYHVQNNVAWSQATLTTLANLFIGWMNDEMASDLSVELLFVAVRCQDMTTSNGLLVEVTFPALSGGDAPEQSLPGNVALCVRHSGAFAGRSRRGRTYIAGLIEGQVQNSTVTAAYRDNIVGGFNGLSALVNASGLTLVVASFYQGYTQNPPRYKKVPTPRAGGAVLTPITNHIADTVVDSQRRRLPGRGI
jgi:hypothetical protein